ncbi:MAG: DUF4290 domain-containing protein [Bacteroides sp.]|nr:DUF4290 domain-containing protein [Bacteroides sp.]MDE7460452.1 DUF4290 domain-containing protein [Paramuribaculum sp.]
MLSYNTQQKRLILPEYGRNIQMMVDHCLTIADRDERTRCAYTIVASMANLFPELRDNPDNRNKLWDHLAIMSNFKLDIDYPCEVIQEENLTTPPAKVPYSVQTIRQRHYGKSLENLVETAVRMEDGDEKAELIRLIANHMKKLMLAVNKDGVDDAKVFKDLADMSHGMILVDPSQMRLHEFKAAPAPTGKKKRKK